MRPIAISGATAWLLLLVACSNDSNPSGKETGDATKSDGAKPDAATTRTPDTFNGDCTTANWSTGSNACWACMCATCAATLNACNEDCTSLLACGLTKHVIVSNAADLACEGRAFTAECLQDPATSSQGNPVTALDLCLIGAHKAPEMLRACEAACNITYTGDVCQRYPATDGGMK